MGEAENVGVKSIVWVWMGGGYHRHARSHPHPYPYFLICISAFGPLFERIAMDFTKKVCFFRSTLDFYPVWKILGGKINN